MFKLTSVSNRVPSSLQCFHSNETGSPESALFMNSTAFSFELRPSGCFSGENFEGVVPIISSRKHPNISRVLELQSTNCSAFIRKIASFAVSKSVLYLSTFSFNSFLAVLLSVTSLKFQILPIIFLSCNCGREFLSKILPSLNSIRSKLSLSGLSYNSFTFFRNTSGFFN